MQELWLELEEEMLSSFSLIAIHTNLLSSQLAYLINQELRYRLVRDAEDLSFSKQNRQFCYLKFTYEDEANHNYISLIGNKNIPSTSKELLVPVLLSDIVEEVNFLIPEYKKVDYFLKIESDDNSVSLQDIIKKIGAIAHVHMVYELDHTDLKSINNLIF